MRKKILLLLLFVLIPIANAIDVSGCTTISSPGVYHLTTDILNEPLSSNEECFNISSSDVIFDCDNHLVDSTFTQSNQILIYGFRVSSGYDNITIRNCKINQFARGIENYGSNLTVFNNSFYGDDYAVLNYGSSDVSIINVSSCTFSSTGQEALRIEGDIAYVHDNEFHDLPVGTSAVAGALFVSGSKSKIFNNVLVDNITDNGIFLAGNNSLIYSNTIVNANGDCILIDSRLADANNITIYDNYLRGAKFNLIALHQSHDVVIKNNKLYYSNSTSVWLEYGAHDITIFNNTFDAINYPYQVDPFIGVGVIQGDSWTKIPYNINISFNSFKNSGDDGIVFDTNASSDLNIVIEHNTFSHIRNGITFKTDDSNMFSGIKIVDNDMSYISSVGIHLEDVTKDSTGTPVVVRDITMYHVPIGMYLVGSTHLDIFDVYIDVAYAAPLDMGGGATVTAGLATAGVSHSKITDLTVVGAFGGNYISAGVYINVLGSSSSNVTLTNLNVNDSVDGINIYNVQNGSLDTAVLYKGDHGASSIKLSGLNNFAVSNVEIHGYPNLSASSLTGSPFNVWGNYGSLKYELHGANITFTSSAPGALPTGKYNVGSFFTAKNITPNGYVIINITYSTPIRKRVGDDLIEIDENTLKVYEYEDGLWTPVPNSVVNTEAHYVWANITSFSDFGVLGDGSVSNAPEFNDFTLFALLALIAVVVFRKV